MSSSSQISKGLLDENSRSLVYLKICSGKKPNPGGVKQTHTCHRMMEVCLIVEVINSLYITWGSTLGIVNLKPPAMYTTSYFHAENRFH